MPPEPVPSATCGTPAPPPFPLADVSLKTLLANQSLAVIFKCLRCYADAIAKHAAPLSQSIENDRRLQRVRSIAGIVILQHVYLHTSFVTDAERALLLSATALAKRDKHGPTRNGLKTVLIRTLPTTESNDAVRLKASRIVDAAIILGFVERDVVAERPNLKPLRGTETLQSLMHEAGVEAALLLRDILSTKDEA